VSKLVSKTMSELEVGMQGSYKKTLSERDIVLFGETSGDVNPVHFDADYAAGTIFKERVAHGMWSASLISTCIGTVMPGPGSLYLGQTLDFKAAVKPGDELTVTATIKEKQKKILIIDCEVTNQRGEIVVSGEAKVIPPRRGAELEAPQLPNIKVEGLDV
jgi:3-hydroxybutyryl-CoA dehydratase